MNKFLKIFTFLLVVSLVACGSEDETLDLDYGYGYFPTNSGHWVEYEIDSIKLEDGFPDVIKNVVVREEIGESFMDNENRNAFTILRHIRPDTSTPFNEAFVEESYIVQTDDLGERVDENLRFIKLTFPLTENKKWWGNSYISEEYTTSDEFENECEFVYYNDNWQYQLTNINQPYEVNGMVFDSTVTVIQNDFEELRDKIYSVEIYAKDVGLIYKEIRDLSLLSFELPPLTELPWNGGRANCGNIITWKVVNYKQ